MNRYEETGKCLRCGEIHPVINIIAGVCITCAATLDQAQWSMARKAYESEARQLGALKPIVITI